MRSPSRVTVRSPPPSLFPRSRSCLRSRAPPRSRIRGPRLATRQLQKCIEGAKSGDRIEISHSGSRPSSSCPIKKSHHSHGRSQRGADRSATRTSRWVRDTSPSTRAIRPDRGGAARAQALRRVWFSHRQGSGTGHRFTVTDCEFSYGGISATWDAEQHGRATTQRRRGSSAFELISLRTPRRRQRHLHCRRQPHRDATPSEAELDRPRPATRRHRRQHGQRR